MWSQHIPTGTGRSTSNKIYHLQSTKYASIPIATSMKIIFINIMIPINKCPGHRKPLGFSDIARVAHGPPRPIGRIVSGLPQPLPRPRLEAEITEAKGFMFNLRDVQKVDRTNSPSCFLLMEQMFDVFVVVNGNELEVFKCVFVFSLLL